MHAGGGRHDLAFSHDRRNRPAVAERFAERGQVRDEPDVLLKRAWFDAECRLHLVQDENGAVPMRRGEQRPKDGALRGQDHFWSDDYGCDFTASLAQHAIECARVTSVELEHLPFEASRYERFERQTPIMPAVIATADDWKSSA